MKPTLLLLVALISFGSLAQNLPAGDPVQLGLSKEGLARVDAFLAKESENQHIPGSIGMIVRHGKVAYKKAFGKANLETGEAMRTDHLFRMASMTKIITGVAGLKLFERGLFTMDTPLETILPEFANMQILVGYDTLKHQFITRPAKNKILMKHVFTHTSGIAYPPFTSLGREGYHRDLQLLKEHLFPAFAELRHCIEMASLMVEHMEVKKDLLNDPKYQYLFSVEEVNKLVNQGMPFRDAYKKIGMDIEAGLFTYTTDIKHQHEGSIGNLCNAAIAAQMELIIKGFGTERVAQRIQDLLSI